MTTIGVFSARADGATTVAVGLASVLAARARTLVLDLNFENPEVATLLDLDPEIGIFHLAYKAQLAPVDRSELEHLGWRDQVAVLPGISRSEDVERISDHFLSALLQTASRSFENLVIDLGRLRSAPPLTDRLLWVVSPRHLGTSALERRYWEAEWQGADWLSRTDLVFNRHDDRAFAAVDRYARNEYGLETAGTIPEAPDHWRRVEQNHSLQALNMAAAYTSDPRYAKNHGDQALPTRHAFETLAERMWTAPLAGVVGSS
jgi:hypothetical protein